MSLQFENAYLFSSTKADAKPTESEALRAPERQRGMWSFLTWSFFLANFLAVTDLIGQSAHASAMPDGDHDPSHSGDDASFAGVSHPDMEHISLESLPTDASGRLADAGAGLNPSALAAAALSDFGAMQLAYPVAQSGADAAAQGDIASASAEVVDDHGGPGCTASEPCSPGGDGGHDVITIVDTVVHPVTEVIAPVIGVVDTVVHTVTDIVGDAGGIVGGVASGVGDLLNTTIDVAATLTDGVGHVLDGVTTTVGTLASTSFDAVSHVLSDTVPTVVTGLMDTVGDTGSSLLHQVADLGDGLASLTSPVASLLDSDGPTGSLLSSVGSGLEGSLNSLGLSSSGSLSFATTEPDAIASHDAGSSGQGYTQFNLAVSDIANDAGGAVSSVTDTGGITTIITSAIGIGHHDAQADADSGDHTSDQQPVHLSVLDDLQSHLHSSLFG